MKDEIKILLGDAANNFSDAQIGLCLKQAIIELEGYCNLRFDEENFELATLAERIAIIKLNRLNTEGLASQSMSGVSENYIDGYPADILAVLNRLRRIKVL